MKKAYRNLLQSGFACAALLFGAAACTDDHFDIQQGMAFEGKTIWQNILETPNLKNFAQILDSTTVLRNDYDKNARLKYSELLNQSQYMTVWAPLDDTYNFEEWRDSLRKVKEYRVRAEAEPELRDSLHSLALKLEYKVGEQFVENHIARFNHEGGVGEQEVHMLNYKIYPYDAAGLKFNTVELAAGENHLASSNGMLHFLNGISPYAYNLSDLLEADPRFSSLYNYIQSENETTFSPSASTEGAMDNSGQMQYVDSVWVTTNAILNSTGAYLSLEDSLYVAFIPTNDKWDEAIQEVESLYNYGKKYETKWNKNGFTGSEDIEDAELLRKENARKALISSMYVSVNSFGSIPEEERKDVEKITEYVLNADSLVATDGTIYYNQREEDTQKNPVLEKAELVKASNGYVFALSDDVFNPAYVWQERMTFSAGSAFLNDSENRGGTLLMLSPDVKNDTISGELPDDLYMRFEADRKKMDVDFALRGVKSGKYRIKIFLLPSHANINYPDTVTYDGKEFLKESIEVEARLLLDDENPASSAAGITSKAVIVSNNEIKAYSFEPEKGNVDYFEIKKCYADLPSDIESFPRLRLSIPRPSKKNPTRNLNVGQIILEPVRE